MNRKSCLRFLFWFELHVAGLKEMRFDLDLPHNLIFGDIPLGVPFARVKFAYADLLAGQSDV